MRRLPHRRTPTYGINLGFLLNLSLCTYQEGHQFDIDTHKYIYLIHLSHTHWLTTFIRLSLRNQIDYGITIEL